MFLQPTHSECMFLAIFDQHIIAFELIAACHIVTFMSIFEQHKIAFELIAACHCDFYAYALMM